ncbi:MAG: hypothetical protein V1899_09020 [Planctomycetota bacterium]
MAETVNTDGTSKVPQTFGEKLAFSFPAILITLILAVGISYGILTVVDGNTRKELTDDLKAKELLLTTEIGKVNQKAIDLERQVGALNTKTAEMEKKQDDVAKKLKEVNDTCSKVADNFAEYVKTQVVEMGKRKDENIATNDSVNKLDRRVVYIEDKIKKIDEIVKDVDGLKVDRDSLKQEHAVLKSDLQTVSKKADVTEKDLTDLSERARLFQLRVLAARAREAADAARAIDLKNLLSKLEDAEGGK